MSSTIAAAAGKATKQRGLGLGAKIGGAFGLVLVLHITVAIMAHAGLNGVRGDMEELDAARRLAMGMAQVDRLVGEVQRHVQGYTQAGIRSLEERAEVAHAELVASLDTVATEVQGAEREAIADMQGLLGRYHEQFRLAVDDRQRRERLVTTDLMHLSGECDAALARTTGSMDKHQEAVQLGQLSRDLLAAQNGAYVYLSRLDTDAIHAAHRALERSMQLLDAPDASETMASLRPTMLPLLRQFDRVLIGIVQTTRGYLHLVHVVMAAEAVEFLARSARLRRTAETRLDQLQRSIREAQDGYQWQSAMVSLVTILLGLVAGGMVKRLVVRPLRAITSTFTRLASGDAATDIPGRERRDEIGAMADAAEVFLRRNAETATLLVETQKLSEQRADSIAALERSNRELDSFVHVASHDLRAPLRAIYSVVGWLEEDCGPQLSTVGKDHLMLLRRRVMRMSSLLSDLSNYSRIGREEAPPEPVDVRSLVLDCAELVNVGSAFKVTLSGPARKVLITRVALEHVIGNLLSNAVRHHDRAAGQIEVVIGGDEYRLEVAVIDDGPGIPARYHATVFEPFKTLQSRDVKESSGIGLAIVRKLVEQYHAAISIESPVKAGRGTCFRLLWPIPGGNGADDAGAGSRLLAFAGQGSS